MPYFIKRFLIFSIFSGDKKKYLNTLHVNIL